MFQKLNLLLVIVGYLTLEPLVAEELYDYKISALSGYPISVLDAKGDYICRSYTESLPEDLKIKLLVTTNVYLREALQYEICISKNISDFGRSIALQAFKQFVRRAMSKEVFTCA